MIVFCQDETIVLQGGSSEVDKQTFGEAESFEVAAGACCCVFIVQANFTNRRRLVARVTFSNVESVR